MRRIVISLIAFASLLLFSPPVSAADQDLIVNEIMYDFPGSDTGHEWVELFNSGDSPITIIGGSTTGAWRINDGANHLFSSTAAQGSMTVGAKEYVIIAQNTATFLSDRPGFSGSLIESSGLSLGNTSATVGLRIGSGGTIWGQATYQNDQGAKGDGNSLQRKTDGSWLAAAPTPGSVNSDTVPTPSPSPSPSPTPTPTTSSTSSPKSPSPTPKPSPAKTALTPSPTAKKSPQILGAESTGQATPQSAVTKSPSPTPTPAPKAASSRTKIAAIFSGSGALLIGLSFGFYLWYKRALTPPKDQKKDQDQ